jgi:dihydropteroate synthase
VTDTYLEPIGLIDPFVTGAAGEPFLGGPRRFIACRRYIRSDYGTIDQTVVPVAELSMSEEATLLARIASPRRPFAGVEIDRPIVMGVLNVTPDSFSDGGDHFDPGRAVEAGHTMTEAGAAIIDVGGESTRPGASEIEPDEEKGRVLPVVRRLADAGVVVSIDTRHAAVMVAALDAGARIINDVSALTHERESLAVAAGGDASIILMHMLGTPETMQDEPHYRDVRLDVYDALADRIDACVAAGIPRHRLAVDPGIGFGKRRQHSLDLLRHLGLLHGLGCAIAIGVSRKLRIGPANREADPKGREAGSLAAVLTAADQGARILRVHDVAATVQALEIHNSLVSGKVDV